MLNTEKGKKIIDDLLIKRPVGPRGSNTYTSSERYCYEKYKDVIDYECQQSFFGYDPLDLYRLDLHGHSQVERYVLQRFYDNKATYELTSGQKGGVTRKTNRLYERLQDAISHINRVGATGTYRVKEGYYGRHELGYVHADSMDDAFCKAKLLFSYVCNEPSEMRVEFIKLGDTADLVSKTAEYVSTENNKIETLKRRIKEAQDEIEVHKARIQAASLVQLHEIANQEVPGVQT